MGPLIFDLIGTQLSAEEREILQHPLIGGLIFFSRNYESPEQITALCQAVRAARKTPILITVDQEGGRVQRFRSGFTRIPSMGHIGRLYDQAPEEGLQFATICGWIMAAELLAVGVDLSFAPVLDIENAVNPAIGDRAFHHNPQVVIQLAKAFTQGMRDAGMAAVGKHFPGHGSVTVDSHLAMPVDLRTFNEIAAQDLVPFAKFAQIGIQGIMAAHIQFPAVDGLPVGFSRYWLQNVLRKQLKFSGIIFSDDLSMEGASSVGGFPARAEAALAAGCDMALICNQRESLVKTLDGLSAKYHALDAEKFNLVQGDFSRVNKRDWQEKAKTFAEFDCKIE